jgi:hypothetical protein
MGAAQMADFGNATSPLTVWLFPGASIMKFTWLSDGLAIVRCPGCGASQLFSTAAPPATFVHEDDECPILRRIEAALAMFNAMVDAEWN